MIEEERIVVEPEVEKNKEEEIIEFIKEMEEYNAAAQNIPGQRFKFDPFLFFMWKNANNRKA